MGFATGRDVHVDQNLTEIALAYRPQGMIADQIAPIVTVNKETNLYPVFVQGEALAVNATLRARSTRANRITRSVSSGNYACKNYALAYGLPIEDRANMDAAFANQLDIGATFIVTDGLMLDWDKRVLSQLSTSSNVSTVFVPSSAWNVKGANGGDPVDQIWQMFEQVQTRTAYRPNSLLFGWKAYNWARRNYNFRNFVLGVNNGGGMVNRAAIANAFEVERFNVAEAFYNSANEAQPTSLSNTFPADGVLAYYAPMQPSLIVPSFMYSFRWTSPLFNQPFAVERHPFDTKTKEDLIEAGYYQDERITSSALAALLLGVGSAQANGL